MSSPASPSSGVSRRRHTGVGGRLSRWFSAAASSFAQQATAASGGGVALYQTRAEESHHDAQPGFVSSGPSLAVVDGGLAVEASVAAHWQSLTRQREQQARENQGSEEVYRHIRRHYSAPGAVPFGSSSDAADEFGEETSTVHFHDVPEGGEEVEVEMAAVQPKIAAPQLSTPTPTAAASVPAVTPAPSPSPPPAAPKMSGDERVDSLLRAASDALAGGATTAAARPTQTFQDRLEGMTQDQIRSLVDGLTPPLLAALQKASKPGGFHEPQHLTFSNLGYWEPDAAHKPVDLLRWVSGYLNPRQLCALIGAPDSGVTPLLDVICGRAIHKAGVTGSVLLNGLPPARDFSQTLGYVTKNEAQFAHLTVWETLLFSARLRGDQNQTEQMMTFRILWILKLLQLSHTVDTIVGDALTRGLSGGEKRRLWFACEAVADHSVLIADLPTNGLDAPSALSLYQHLRFFADHFGLSMLSSMTQASPELFQICDTVCLLSKGTCIYFGPVANVNDHLAAQGFRRPAGSKMSLPGFLEHLSAHPEQFWADPSVPLAPRLSPLMYQNIVKEVMGADNLLTKDQMRIDYQRRYADALASHSGSLKTLHGEIHDRLSDVHVPGSFQAWHRLYEGYQQSTFYEDVLFREQRQKMIIAKKQELEAVRDLKVKVDLASGRTPAASEEEPIVRDHRQKAVRYRANIFTQFWLCLVREMTLTLRNKGMWLGNFVKSVAMGLIVGSLFWDVGNDQASIRTRMGLLYFSFSFIIAGAVQLISVLNEERNILYHQTASGYYSGLAYYLSMTVTQIPFAAIETFLFIVILYPMAGLSNGVGSTEFLFAFLVLFLVDLVGRSIALFGTAITPSQAGSQAMVMLITLLSTFFCGYLSPKSLIPIGWRWMYTISFFTYALRGYAVSQFTAIGEMDCSDTAVGATCAYTTGYAALEQYDMQEDSDEQWNLLLNVFWFWLAFNAATCAALSFLDFRARTKFEPPKFFDGNPALAKRRQESMSRLDAADEEIQKSFVVPIQPGGDAAAAKPLTIRTFAFRHVSFEIDIPASKKGPATTKKLLKGCYGFSRTNQLLALMGPSGAGKTTLLDVLAQMKTIGRTYADLVLDGKPLDKDVSVGYVEQFDSHSELSTVREAILFSCRLRRPELTPEEVDATVDDLLDLLGLSHLANERIGNPQVDGVSPEVRKKVTIGVELVKNPMILYADECTTGLDASAAINLMKLLKKLTRRMTVIVTVHQPAVEIVDLFDSLLLCVAGEVAFFGPMPTLLPYLEENGFGTMPPSQHNVADFAMTQIATAFKGGRNPAKIFAECASSRAIRAELAECFVEQDAKLPAGVTAEQHIAATPWKLIKLETVATFGKQVRYLSARSIRTNFRDTPAVVSRIFITTFMSFLQGTLFYQLRADQAGAPSFFSVIYMMAVFATMSAVVALPGAFMGRALYFRETVAAMYKPETFFFARFITDLPLTIIELFISLILVYFLCGLGGNFGIFIAIFLGARIMSLNLTYFLCSVSSTIELANSLVSVIATIANLFSGFLIAKSSIPAGWEWMYYVSYLRYPLTAAGQNELRAHDEFTCDTSVQYPWSAVPESSRICPVESVNRCPIQCGKELLSSFGLKTTEQDMSQNVGITYVYATGFLLIALAVTKYVNFIRR